MASSLSYDPFARASCIPRADNNDGQSQNITLNKRNKPDGMMKQAEDLLASEMSKLSVKERSDALDDVHCVGEELKETPEMVQKALADFAQAVQKKQNQHPIYLLALNQNRAYVEDHAFRLKFLRANFFDAEKSVRQMMAFLEYKAEYFGQDKVAREIVMSDLTEADIDMLLSGIFHLQEGRDRMGRVIIHDLDVEKI